MLLPILWLLFECTRQSAPYQIFVKIVHKIKNRSPASCQNAMESCRVEDRLCTFEYIDILYFSLEN